MGTLHELFGTNVKRFRHMNGLTQVKLAELCGLSSSYIVEIETSRKFPTVDVIETLARELRIEPHQLFYRDDGQPGNGQFIHRNQMLILKDRFLTSIDTIFRDFELK